MSRPAVGRTASTNLSGGSGYRQLEGKLAIVTGASRGIGAAICTNLASKGCSLIMNYTSDSSASPTQSLASELESTYQIKTTTVQADMGSTTGPAYIVDTALNHFKHPKTGKLTIDILINNAGVAGNETIAQTTPENFHKIYTVNVLGPLLLVKAVEPYLPHDRSGRIVNLSSVSSSLGFAGQSTYGGSKAALEAMTRTWARELSERATVNAVNPGPVATDMYASNGPAFYNMINPWLKNTPLAAVRKDVDKEEFVEKADEAGGRPAYEDEIAGVVAMLCSPEAGWSTGSVVCANGGMRFSP
ncbi:NAD(P)-binding protein [Saccharata proteae CBS 121410]|uniref:NAD(P)-binding protein n=1 Tax=Saccharata proteae CBS 121410 TaxID=1314787 RepID=A0A9P4HSF9_9PEZI|nr:NAD(P)-binding protein [Saccharata proteae CBS 121410]